MPESAAYRKALALHESLKKEYARVRRAEEQGKPVPEEADQLLRTSVSPQMCYHFKHPDQLYVVLGVRRIRGSDEYQILYTPLYNEHRGEIALRPLLGKDGFLMPIQRINYVGERFIKTKDLTLDEATFHFNADPDSLLWNF